MCDHIESPLGGLTNSNWLKILRLDVPEARFTMKLPQVDDLARAKTASPHVTSVGYSDMQFNVTAQRYFYPSGAAPDGVPAGTFLPASHVRQATLDNIQARAEDMQSYLGPLQEAAQARKDGLIDDDEYGEAVNQWREQMQDSIKNLHLNNSAAAQGGFHAMDSQSYGRVGGFLKYHYGKLSDLSDEIYLNPDIVLGEAAGKMQLAQRVGLYAKTALMTYEAERVASHSNQGFTHYKNVQHSQESCKGCLAETAKEWQIVGTGVPLGKRTCGPADLCTWDFTRAV